MATTSEKAKSEIMLTPDEKFYIKTAPARFFAAIILFVVLAAVFFYIGAQVDSVLLVVGFVVIGLGALAFAAYTYFVTYASVKQYIAGIESGSEADRTNLNVFRNRSRGSAVIGAAYGIGKIADLIGAAAK